MSRDENDLAGQLTAAGWEVGISKSGRLLRADNRGCRRPVDPRLLEKVLGCASLRELWLRDVEGFLGAHIDCLAGLEKLKSLDVEGSDLDDDALDRLAGQSTLQVLNVRNTRVTQSRVVELRKVMIDTRIIF